MMYEFLDINFLGNPVRSYLIFLLALLVGLLLRSFGVKVLGKIILLVFSKSTKAALLRDLINFIKQPVYNLIFFLILYAGFYGLKNPEIIEDIRMVGYIITGLHYLFQIIIVVFVIWFINSLIRFWAHRKLIKAEADVDKPATQLIPFARDILRIVIVIIGLVFIMGGIFKFNVTSIIAGLGIGGLALALAAQETLANLLASFTIFLDKPFTVGDFIQVGEVVGVVERVGIRSTRIRTLEKSYLTLPNKMLVDEKVDNLSLRTFRRVRFSFGVVYHTTVPQIQEIVKDIQEILDNHPNTNQEGVVRFYEFGNSSLDILVNYFVDTMEWYTYLRVREEINFQIMEVVKKHASSFAFPTQTLHFHKEEKS
jgi:MscS family membrane protein